MCIKDHCFSFHFLIKGRKFSKAGDNVAVVILDFPKQRPGTAAECEQPQTFRMFMNVCVIFRSIKQIMDQCSLDP